MLEHNPKAMFDLWKTLKGKKKNVEKNGFLVFGFIMKNYLICI